VVDQFTRVCAEEVSNVEAMNRLIDDRWTGQVSFFNSKRKMDKHVGVPVLLVSTEF